MDIRNKFLTYREFFLVFALLAPIIEIMYLWVERFKKEGFKIQYDFCIGNFYIRKKFGLTKF